MKLVLMALPLNGFTNFEEQNSKSQDMKCLLLSIPISLWFSTRVLGPDLFNIYVMSLYKYIEPSKFDTLGFTGDHQLVKHFYQFFMIALGHNIRYCFNMISNWMSEFLLCLNSNKTKLLVITPLSMKEEIVINGTIINDGCIRFVSHARNL